MRIIRILLFPFSILYGLITGIRNLFYDKGIFRSTRFDIPVIAVGNLTAGGTGKSPLIEHLLEILHDKYKVATLSRGYGRTSNGFHEVNTSEDVLKFGDEPSVFRLKFPKVVVAVGENRVKAIHKIRAAHPEIQVCLLDDAFQHRKIKASLNILLIGFKKLFQSDYMLPTGDLREWKSGIKRADLIIITKCPSIFSPIEQRRCLEELKVRDDQHVYFSSIVYGEIKPILGEDSSLFSNDYYFSRKYSVLLFTGIANAEPLVDFLEDHLPEVVSIQFKDHHNYLADDLDIIRKKFDSIANKNKIIITTEKDRTRLVNSPALKSILEKMHIFYIPITTKFHESEGRAFDDQILHHIKNFT